ncbi:MAG: PHP domain-containing protein [Pelolinea sp.]|nr:PHP domain-containing protein [Pelolinea sp.]
MSDLNSKKWITAELHCHSIYSHDSSNQLEDLIQTARERGIERLAITDHNTIAGALLAKKLAPELIVVGEEVHTERGELIGYYMKEEIPRGLSVKETLRRFKDQGAFISIPHPFDLWRHGWRSEELLELLPEVDAVEVLNARCLLKVHNINALAFSKKYNKPMLAGSDAHTLLEVGLAVTRLPVFNSAEEMRVSVEESQIDGRMLSVGDHLKTSLQVGWSKMIGTK